MKLNACCTQRTIPHSKRKSNAREQEQWQNEAHILKNPFDDNSRYTMDALFLPFPGVHIKSNSKSIYV